VVLNGVPHAREFCHDGEVVYGRNDANVRDGMTRRSHPVEHFLQRFDALEYPLKQWEVIATLHYSQEISEL
jgi:hypothetical protein